MRFDGGAPRRTLTQIITGRLQPGAPDWVYLPVVVPDGVSAIAASYSYHRPEVVDGAVGNACDLGVFDPRGIEFGGEGFRGWSGGARTGFMISENSATPGYLPGPVPGGTWHVALAPYTVSSEGLGFTVRVAIGFGSDSTDEVVAAVGTDGEPAVLPRRSAPPPQRIGGRGPGWYRGDSHVHSIYSDGRRTPERVAELARAGGLDFMISTEHNTPAAHPVWGALAGDDLLIITGEEVTTRNGHLLALGIEPGSWVDWRFRAIDDQLGQIADRIHDLGGIAVAAHPYGGCIGCFWKFGYAAVDAVEVWNGPWGIHNECAVATWDNLLVAGDRDRWLPAMGNSDAHADPDVIGLPRTVVQAAELSSSAITEAITAGRSWIAESGDVDLDFIARADGAPAGIGERLPTDRQAVITVSARVSGVPNGRIRLVTDQGELQAVPIDDAGSAEVTWQTTASLSAYVRLEVRHPLPAGVPLPFGPMAAMTNPIFLG
ncbi:phosphoesterase [Microlunatus elymi]|uniref:Phosphoesterase n=1 Tax=Microlunatus elymi TaxID=2596828 RepID=A0A516Q5J2_9ACTN|nr:phosphoesterase [Microlunatus elymi]